MNKGYLFGGLGLYFLLIAIPAFFNVPYFGLLALPAFLGIIISCLAFLFNLPLHEQAKKWPASILMIIGLGMLVVIIFFSGISGPLYPYDHRFPLECSLMHLKQGVKCEIKNSQFPPGDLVAYINGEELFFSSSGDGSVGLGGVTLREGDRRYPFDFGPSPADIAKFTVGILLSMAILLWGIRERTRWEMGKLAYFLLVALVTAPAIILITRMVFLSGLPLSD